MADESENIKTLADARLDKLEALLKELQNKSETLESENAALRKANKELYSAAVVTEAKEPEQPVAPATEVGVPSEEEIAAQQKKDFDQMFKLTLEKLGYPSSQKDGM